MLSEEEDPNAWNWLVENDLQGNCVFKKQKPSLIFFNTLDLAVNKESASVVAWKLLQTYLTNYEEPRSTLLHKAVCQKIISMRMYVPFWLLSSYKVRFFCNQYG